MRSLVEHETGGSGSFTEQEGTSFRRQLWCVRRLQPNAGNLFWVAAAPAMMMVMEEARDGWLKLVCMYVCVCGVGWGGVGWGVRMGMQRQWAM